MTPVPVVGGLTFSQIAVITAASCGITVDKSLYCWGMRSYPPGGQSPVPVQREAGSVWQSISAGRGERLCGTTTDHTYCWQTIDLGTPLAASRPFVQASGGVAHTCFLDAAGIAYCNGFSAYGAIGNGKIPPYSIGDPVAVTGDLRFKSISAGNDFTCAVTVDGVLYCWGHNGAGRVGAPSITVDMRSLISPSSSVQCKYFVCAIGGIYLTPQKVLGQP
jgi:alpha-tubulin suppressor-like RCC1 family protein